jgi:hypothetical protein
MGGPAVSKAPSNVVMRNWRSLHFMSLYHVGKTWLMDASLKTIDFRSINSASFQYDGLSLCFSRVFTICPRYWFNPLFLYGILSILVPTRRFREGSKVPREIFKSATLAIYIHGDLSPSLPFTLREVLSLIISSCTEFQCSFITLFPNRQASDTSMGLCALIIFRASEFSLNVEESIDLLGSFLPVISIRFRIALVNVGFGSHLLFRPGLTASRAFFGSVKLYRFTNLSCWAFEFILYFLLSVSRGIWVHFAI